MTIMHFHCGTCKQCFASEPVESQVVTHDTYGDSIAFCGWKCAAVYAVTQHNYSQPDVRLTIVPEQ